MARFLTRGAEMSPISRQKSRYVLDRLHKKCEEWIKLLHDCQQRLFSNQAMSQDVRVLIGDDDVNDRFFLEWGFKQTCPNVQVDFARNGEEVIQYLEDHSDAQPAFLILDSLMPRMDGFAVVDWLRSKKIFDRMPVVMISGKIHEANTDRAMKLGVQAYIEKPDDFPQLLALVRQWQKSYLTDSADN